MEFDLAGHVRLVLSTDDPGIRRAIAAEMDPYIPQAGTTEAGDAETAPSVVLAPIEPGEPAIAELQLGAGDGFVTGSADGALYLLTGDRRALVPDALADEPAVVRWDPDFPMRRLIRGIVRPALQLRALGGGSVALHAAAVERGGAAVLVAGWSESGKTETALALTEAGGRFLTDKWTLLGPDGTAAPFPVSVGVRRWALSYLPRLRDAVPGRARARLAVAGAAAAASRPIRGRRGLRGMAALLRDGTERAVALADRVALSPSEIAAAYGHEPIRSRVPVGLVVVLRTVPGSRISALPGDPVRLSRRLAVSAATERQAYHALRLRAAYASASTADPGTVAALEAERLRAMLSSVPLVEVSAPFPTDPRAVVDALAPWLPPRP
jgi:hypothetical protein